MKKQSQDKTRSYRPQKISEALTKINQNLLYKLGKIDYVIHAKWSDIVGAYFIQHSQPEKISIISNPTLNESEEKDQKRILHVNVTPAAAIEFQHFQNKIIEKINSFFGYQAIHGFKIHQKLVQKNPLRPIQKSPKNNDGFDKKNTEINDTTRKINDKELEKSLINLGISISTNEED